jgi:hypothetical protein
MKKLISISALAFILAGCALLSPYNVTFTTRDGSVINPQTSTLDFVVNSPTLAYVSEISCEGSESLELLPVLTDDMEVSKAHNLSLINMAAFADGTKCEVTVTALDNTTTANTRASVTLYVNEMPVEEEEVEGDVEAEDGDVEETEDEVTDETTTDDTTAEPSEDSSEEEPAA